MSFRIYLLLCVMIGALFLMVGILFTKEPEQTIRSAFKESLAWGAGFFLMLSTQVVANAAMN